MNLKDYLKELLGDEAFATIEPKLSETKAKFVDLKDGQYVDKSKYDALDTQFKGLQDQVKAFDGVDVESLKKSATEWEQKYNEDLKNIKINNAIELALVGSKAKNQKAIKALLNSENIKLDGDNVTGISEQIELLKGSDPYLFDVDDKSPQPQKGFKMGSPTTSYTMADIQKMSTAEINANWNKPEFQEALKQQK